MLTLEKTHITCPQEEHDCCCELTQNQIDQMVVDAFNKSHQGWVARGWFES
jgi:hypothetical protein